MSRSIQIAIVIFIGISSYFAIRTLSRDVEPEPQISIATARVNTSEADIPVVVVPVRRETHEIFLELRGRTEAEREVVVRSETTGTVVSAPVAEGRLVRRGDLLCGLGVEARQARIAEADAAVRSATLDYNAARRLADQGWTSEGQAASAKATLDAAEASRNAAKIELRKTRLTAPFSGVFEQRMAENGDFLPVGGECGRLVDLDPILISVDVAEAFSGRLSVGAPAEVILSNGQIIEGKLRFTARTADTSTRTFRVVAEADNQDGAIPAGLSADLRISLGEADASLISSALLVLHDDGRVGVRYVDDENIVQFASVTVIDDAVGGVWVTGLGPFTRVLDAGQDFVREGVRVTPSTLKGPTP